MRQVVATVIVVVVILGDFATGVGAIAGQSKGVLAGEESWEHCIVVFRAG